MPNDVTTRRQAEFERMVAKLFAAHPNAKLLIATATEHVGGYSASTAFNTDVEAAEFAVLALLSDLHAEVQQTADPDCGCCAARLRRLCAALVALRAEERAKPEVSH